MMRLACVAALCVASTAAAAPRTAEIEKLLEQKRTELHIAGLAAVVVVDDKVVLVTAKGLRDVGKQLPVTPATVFPIGSCTKAFTALAAGIAQDEGLLALDDSPHRFLPWFRMRDAEADRLVTLRDMLSHRTGLKAYADLAALPGVLTREEYLRAAIGAVPAAKLRETFQYSNAMVTAAGELVARATKLTWDKVIATRIFAPLGMATARTDAWALAGAPDAVVGYAWDPATAAQKAQPMTESLRAMAPAGSVAASATDMARWLRMLIGGGALEGKRIVSEATFRELIEPHTPINDSLSYALGWVVYAWNGHRVVEHNGGAGGLSALTSFMPDKRAGFVVLANSSPTDLTRIGQLAAQLWPLILDDKATPAAPAPPPRASKPAPIAGVGGALPTPQELIERAIRASGGARTLARHTAMEVRAIGTYAHQGIDLDVAITLDRGKSLIDERWRVGGKPIGRVRQWFDGVRGAQQTTFGQDETSGPEAISRSRRAASPHPIAETTTLYSAIKVDRKVVLDGEDAYVLVLTPAIGTADEYYLSARTGLILRRDGSGESTRYSDYRRVDGELVPFAIDTTGAELGDKHLVVKELRWTAPPTAFAPVAKLAR